MQIDHVAVRVPSLPQAVRLLQGVLGGEVTSSEHAPNVGTPVAYLRLGHYEIELYEDPSAPAGLDHLAVQVDDLSEASARLAELGVRTMGEELDATRGSRAILLDPSTTCGVRMHLCAREVQVDTDERERPMLAWELLSVGESFGPIEYRLDGDHVAAFHEAVGHDSSSDRCLPTILAFPMMQLIESKYRPRPGGIHAAQELSWQRPLLSGQVLRVSGVLASMYLKRGRRYFTVDADFEDDGGAVASGTLTGLLPS